MRKMLMVLVALSAMVFMMGGVAFAEGWATGDYEPTHYNFSLTTEGCAGCHVTHVADAKFLLNKGPSQTDFCYGCHQSFLASPYDVEKGRIKPVGAVKNGTVYNASTAGGFNFLAGNQFLATSIHNVETPGVAASGDFDAARIPGVINTTNPLTGGFRCGSCHDPHAGDKFNDRLLRVTPITGGGTVGDAAGTAVDFVYNTTTLVVSDYGSSQTALNNLNNWCGTCHNRFNVGDNAGRNLNNGKYRHAMGVAVDPTKTTLDAYLGVKSADNLAYNNKNYINCLTCHYAHGSDKAKMDTYTSWKRDFASTDTDGSGNFTETDSTLLRMDKRGVCFDCHGAAANNVEAFGQTNNTP